MSSFPLPRASLQLLPPHPSQPLRPAQRKGFPRVCNSQNVPPEGSVGPTGVDRVTSAPCTPLPDHRLALWGDVLRGGQLSQMLLLLLVPQHELPTRDLRRAGRLSTLHKLWDAHDAEAHGHTLTLTLTINLHRAKGQGPFSSLFHVSIALTHRISP